MLTKRLSASLLFAALSCASVSTWANVRCEVASLSPSFEPDRVLQLIKAEGSATTQISEMYPSETAPAFFQIRKLETSTRRDHQVKSHERAASGAKSALIKDPQLVQVSGGGLVKPFLIVLPSHIDMATGVPVELESRVESGDPSQNHLDFVQTKLLSAHDRLVYEESTLRHRQSYSSMYRAVELRGSLHQGSFIVTHLTLHVRESNAEEATQIEIDLPEALILSAK